MLTDDKTNNRRQNMAEASIADNSSPVTSQPSPTKRPETGKNKNGGFWSTILVIVSALAMAFLLVTFVFHSYQVDGSSMESSLHNGDRLIVWKVPRTIAHITGHPYIPNRGDVIVFTEKGLSGYGQSQDEKQLIKRVVGLPGDHVVVKDNLVTIYNKSHPNGFDPDKTLPYGQVIGDTTRDLNEKIGKNQLFVMGDNRPDSLDSRYFGPINANQIIGKLVLRILPIGQITKF